MFGLLARMWLIRRLFGGGNRRPPAYRYGSRYGSPYGYGRRRPQRSRGNFGFFGPVPTYSTRTRGGTRVSVGGCCLPIPLALSLGGAGLLRVMSRRARS